MSNITYRGIKGYALTHEELDANFNDFDEASKAIVGTELYCPTGDNYIYDINYGTDKDFVLLDTPQSSIGVMGVSQTNVPFRAILNKSTKINHSGAIVPLDFINFGLYEEKIQYVERDSVYTTIDFEIVFSDYVDLIEIESDLVSVGVTSYNQCVYQDGEIQIATGGTLSAGVDYITKNSLIRFQSSGPVTIPGTWNDLDPFGDGSQIHLYKFENNGVDTMGNGNISGTASFSNTSLVGSNSLLLQNENVLSAAMLNTDLLTNEGFSFTCGIRLSEGSNTLGLLDPPNSLFWRDILTFDNATGYLNGLSFATINFWDFLADTTRVVEYVKFWSGDPEVNGIRKCSDPTTCTVSPMNWGTGYTSFKYKDGKTYSSTGGWNYFGANDLTVLEDLQPYTERDTTAFVPTTITFNEDKTGNLLNAEAMVDELRVFNRPLKPSEGYMLTNLLGGTLPTIYNTTGGPGIDSAYGQVDPAAHKQLLSINHGGTLVSFGTPTVDEVNKKITYSKRTAYAVNRLIIRVERQQTGWYGTTFKVRGYKKI